MKKLVCLAVVFFGALFFAAPAMALTQYTQSYQIRIVAVVPPQRTLYVTDDNLVKIASNSALNTPPVAVDLKTNTNIEVSARVLQQYESFLTLHDNYLKPGFYWPPKPQPKEASKPVDVLRLSLNL